MGPAAVVSTRSAAGRIIYREKYLFSSSSQAAPGPRCTSAEATGDFLGNAIAVGDFDANGAPTIQLREFGADVRMVSGRIQLGPVSHATTRGGFVDIAHPGLTNVADWYGDIHNHLYSGDGRPSPADINSFNGMLSQLRQLGLPTHNRYMYIVVQDPASVSGYSTYAYNENSNYNDLGPEVNPNAQTCP